MNRLLAVALSGCCLVPAGVLAEKPPIPAHPKDLRFAKERIELPDVENRRVELVSGTVVYLAEDHTLPLVEISLALRVGSFLEPPRLTGLAFLTATQMRRGGSADLDADRFDNRLDFLGARISTMSGTTRSGASLSVPSWALEEGLDLFFAMLAQPGFQADRLSVSRGNLLESFSRRNENALEILEREWDWLMYGEDHFSTRPMTSGSLQAIRRADLQEFHQNHWCPDRMILAISGDFDRQSLLSSLEQGLARSTRADIDREPSAWPPPPPKTSATPGLYHHEMDIPQAKVMLGQRFPALLDWSDRDRFTLAVLGELLGGQGAISRIAGRLRTAEGLVYRASAELYPGDLWPGELQIFFETRGSSVDRAITLALEEVERLRTESVHPMELAVVKQSLLARLRLRFDTAEEIAGYFAEDELLGRPHTFWQDYLAGVGNVTVAQVQETAKAYLQRDAMLFLTVGRWREISSGEGPGVSPLEALTGHPRTLLRTRDPLTLEVLALE